MNASAGLLSRALACSSGYNTNGFAHHRLEDAIEILAELGYRGVALTLDVHHLDPFAAGSADTASRSWPAARPAHCACVIETGARFLLDPRRKHQPTLLDPRPEERAIRLDFLEALRRTSPPTWNADCVSFWSGTPTDDAPPRRADGPAGRRLQAARRYAAEPERPPRVRAGAGHVHRHDGQVRRTARQA